MAWFVVSARAGLGSALPERFIDQMARLGARRGAGATWILPSRRRAEDLHDRLALLLGDGDGLSVAQADDDDEGCCGPRFSPAPDARTREVGGDVGSGARVIDLTAHRRRQDD